MDVDGVVDFGGVFAGEVGAGFVVVGLVVALIQGGPGPVVCGGFLAVGFG